MTSTNPHRYDDLMGLPHHVSGCHPQMPMQDRAAQFSPFAALTGYDAAIQEAGRRTEEKIMLAEDALHELDRKLQLLMDRLREKPEVRITYFLADQKKSGGAYVSAAGTVQKMNIMERWIVMHNGAKIPIDDIYDISGPLFSSLG